MTEPFELTTTEAANSLRSRELSSVELTESLLKRIETLEPKLKAWVYLDSDAVILEAERRDRELASGIGIGPLHGIPIGLKDIYHNAGIPTTACSKVFANFIPYYDATTVVLMKRAGAIMLGKLVTTEFAYVDPSPTMNPWNMAHTPGGSSSGSAVAVAAQMCPAAMGSQTVGSVLRPASYNGVVGLKPTYGLVSRYGIVPMSWSLDTAGWMTRTVKDSALLLNVMAGYDQHDPITSRMTTPDYLAKLENPSPPSIGVIRQFFHDHSDAETRQHLDGVIDTLSKNGTAVDEISLPESFHTSHDDQQTIMAVEAAAFHAPMFQRQADDYSPKLRALIEKGLKVDALTYSRALENRQRFITDMEVLASQQDILITASTPTPSLADVTNTGRPLFQGPWTSCGLPTISIPSGLATSGVPLGIQLISAHFSETTLLSAGSWCESVLNVDLSPPL